MGRRRKTQPSEISNKTSVSLENYRNLLRSPISVHANIMTAEQLNEILQMHGYCKNHRLPKEEILEALGKIPLQIPERSTLNQTRCPYGYVPTLEEVNRDLELLGWEEEEESTVMESIETVNYKAIDIAIKSDGGNVIRRKRNTRRKIEDNLGMVIPRRRRSGGGRKRRKYKEVNADGSVGADGLISAVDCLDYGPNLWGFY